MEWTGDEIIERGGIWVGQIADLRVRMNDYTIDGVRYGTMFPTTRSGSAHDRRLEKHSEEAVTAVFILARLGYDNIRIEAKGADGSQLDRPDLDVTFDDGTRIGVEIAQGGTRERLKHDSGIALVEHSIRDLIDDDPTFASAFGPYYVALSPSGAMGEKDVLGKRAAEAIRDEFVAFVRAGGHRVEQDGNDPEFGYFGAEYPTLHESGSTYHPSKMDTGPYFSVMDGGTINPRPNTNAILETIDDHRKSALKGYRTERTWMLMYLSDSSEMFRQTLRDIEKRTFDVAPFEEVHIADAIGSDIASFRLGDGSAKGSGY